MNEQFCGFFQRRNCSNLRRKLKLVKGLWLIREAWRVFSVENKKGVFGEREREKMAEEKNEEVEKKMMSPWEQHSAVINLPRFDYNAPSSLLRNSHTGFLITCTISSVSSPFSSLLIHSLFPFVSVIFYFSFRAWEERHKRSNHHPS